MKTFMLALQIANPGNIGVMSCIVGDQRFLSILGDYFPIEHCKDEFLISEQVSVAV